VSVAVDIVESERPRRLRIVASNPAVFEQTGRPIGFGWAAPSHPFLEFRQQDDEDDVAGPGGGALRAKGGHAGRIYEATGPRLWSFAEAVEELAVVTRRRVRYVRASSERHAALLAAEDAPEEVLVRLRRVIDKLVDGRDAGLRRGSGTPQPAPRSSTA
jgi:hypothetical protein